MTEPEQDAGSGDEPEAGKNSEQDSEQDSEQNPESAWQRRQRLARIFGDVLPDRTSDELDPDEAGAESAGDAWLKSQVPPHHGS